MIHNDLDMINRTLNELISELEHPCSYGNNLKDAQAYLTSFERFEKTVEVTLWQLHSTFSMTPFAIVCLVEVPFRRYKLSC